MQKSTPIWWGQTLPGKRTPGSPCLLIENAARQPAHRTANSIRWLPPPPHGGVIIPRLNLVLLLVKCGWRVVPCICEEGSSWDLDPWPFKSLNWHPGSLSFLHNVILWWYYDIHSSVLDCILFASRHAVLWRNILISFKVLLIVMRIWHCQSISTIEWIFVMHMWDYVAYQLSFSEAAFKMAKRTKKVGITGKYGTR